jgi:hypothetical protein
VKLVVWLSGSVTEVGRPIVRSETIVVEGHVVELARALGAAGRDGSEHPKERELGFAGADRAFREASQEVPLDQVDPLKSRFRCSRVVWGEAEN